MSRRNMMLIVAAVAVIAVFIPRSALAGEALPPVDDAKIDSWLVDRLSRVDGDAFLVLFDPPEALTNVLAGVEGMEQPGRAVYDRLRGRARSVQAATRAWLDDHGIPYRSLYVVNGLRIEGSLPLARALAARSEVVRIVGDPLVRGLSATSWSPLSACGLPWGVTMVRADDVWALDAVRGAGVVVASADTGVQWNHPALIGAYRGWSGSSASHDYNWHDAIEDLASPLDDYGHGTHTVGTMVGEDAAAGEQIGVAPGAKWIGCRNMDHGNGRPSTYLECNQYFLAPWPHGGDPERDGDPSRAPHIINNSWGCPTSEGCDPGTLRASFAALRSAGILAVVSAGNSGPSCSTVTDPPAIYEESFVVGAVGSNRSLASFSSKGPVTVDASNRIRPDVVAPGVGVCSSVPIDGYGFSDGTSMAGPHAAGVAALLWSAHPNIRNAIGVTRCMLGESADPTVSTGFQSSCGGTTASDLPNNMFGWGIVDAYAAIHGTRDNDGDGVPRNCDCAPSNSGAYDVPVEVGGLRIDADKTTWRWDSLARQAGSATVYDLVRGDLAELASTGTINGAACIAGGLTLTSFADPSVPSPGLAFYHVVAARNTCGSGGWGSASSGVTRTHATCP